MPIYEYKCDKCGNEFEEIVSLSSDCEAECPECGEKKTRRKISAFAFGGGGGKRPQSLSSGGSCGPGG